MSYIRFVHGSYLLDLSINHPDLMAIRHRPKTIELTQNIYATNRLVNHIPVESRVSSLRLCPNNQRKVLTFSSR
jgi:hypothetical protein